MTTRNEQLANPYRICIKCKGTALLRDPFRLCVVCRNWLENIWCMSYYAKKNKIIDIKLLEVKPLPKSQGNWKSTLKCGCYEDPNVYIWCKLHSKEHDGVRVKSKVIA